MIDFTFDEGAFMRVAEDAVKVEMQEMQSRMDRLGSELEGQPIDVAKLRLQQEWERGGGELTDPELTAYAAALVEGTRIVFEYGGLT